MTNTSIRALPIGDGGTIGYSKETISPREAIWYYTGNEIILAGDCQGECHGSCICGKKG